MRLYTRFGRSRTWRTSFLNILTGLPCCWGPRRLRPSGDWGRSSASWGSWGRAGRGTSGPPPGAPGSCSGLWNTHSQHSGSGHEEGKVKWASLQRCFVVNLKTYKFFKIKFEHCIGCTSESATDDLKNLNSSLPQWCHSSDFSIYVISFQNHNVY